MNENLHLKIKEDEKLILSLNSEIDNNKFEINQLNKEVKVCKCIFIKLYMCVDKRVFWVVTDLMCFIDFRNGLVLQDTFAWFNDLLSLNVEEIHVNYYPQVKSSKTSLILLNKMGFIFFEFIYLVSF